VRRKLLQFLRWQGVECKKTIELHERLAYHGIQEGENPKPGNGSTTARRGQQ
jgi:hypothetical protein